MKVFITHASDSVVVRSKAEGQGGILEDFKIEVRPGSDFLGWSYEELRALGEGQRELDWKRRP